MKDPLDTINMGFLKRSFDTTMHKAQASMLPFAQELAENKGLQLDYSAASIVVLDSLLVFILDDARREGIHSREEMVASDAIDGIARALGCYIVEVIERNHSKGKWIKEDIGTGEPRIGYIMANGNTIFPFDWVLNKLTDPKAYSIEQCYRAYVTA